MEVFDLTQLDAVLSLPCTTGNWTRWWSTVSYEHCCCCCLLLAIPLFTVIFYEEDSRKIDTGLYGMCVNTLLTGKIPILRSKSKGDKATYELYLILRRSRIALEIN